MKARTLLLAALAVAPIAALAAPPTAANVLAAAEAKAKATQRNVMLIYHASWCGWCHKLDDVLNSPEMSATMNKAFVIVHVDVMENGDKKDLENAGGMDQAKKYGYDEKHGGIPFFAFLKPDGTMIGNSNRPGEGNIGYPGEPAEVDYFMTLINKSTPMLSDGERGKVESCLRAESAKLKQGGGH